MQTAYVGVYPTKDEAIVHGRDETFEYRYGPRYVGVNFCRTCGVHVYSTVYGPPITVYDKLPPPTREAALAVYHKSINLQPLNLRAAEELDLASINISRSDEGTEGYQLDP